MSVEEMAQKRYCHGVKADCTVQHNLDKKLFMTSNSKQCDVNNQVKQTHHKSNDDQVEKGHIISFSNTIVQPVAVMIKLLCAPITTAAMLRRI